MGSIFDIDDGDFLFRMSDCMLMDSDGHMMSVMSDNTAMDMETGDIHFISGGSSLFDDDDDDQW